MSEPRFVDTNVLLRFILGDHVDHSRRARDLFRRIELGEERIRTSDTVVFEAVYSLEGRIAMPRQMIADIILASLSFEGIILEHKALLATTFRRFVAFPRLSFADCFHATLAESLTGGVIYTFDRDFDRITEIERVEPI